VANQFSGADAVCRRERTQDRLVGWPAYPRD